jgi:T5SS/PEP-CTERM-associated repeat protein
MPNGYQYAWKGTLSNNLNLAANWENLNSGTTATAAPGINDEATIAAQGTLTGTTDMYALTITGTGSGISVAGQIDAQFLTAAGTINILSGGALTADVNTTVQNAAVLTIGNATTGAINVQAGGTISANWNAANQYALILGQNHGTGILNLSGPGALATINDIASIGYGGAGTLTVSNGASLTAGGGAYSLTIGDNSPTGPGTGAVSISNSNATLNGLIGVGAFGQGALTVAGTSTVIETAGMPSDWSMLIGESAGINGTVTAAFGANLTLARGIGVGAAGNGTLTVALASITVNAPANTGLLALEVGLEAGSTGQVTLNEGSFTDTAGAGIVIGAAGNGTLTIMGGGTLTTGASAGQTGLAIGDASGASGTATITGSTSALTCNGQVLVGDEGRGTLTATTGATLNAGTQAAQAGLVIGNGTADASASFSSNAQIHVTGQIGVGANGPGSLTVDGASTLTATATAGAALELGENAGATGTALISDAGTTLTLAGGLVVGANGTGNLTVQNGAQITTATTGTATPAFEIAAGPSTSSAASQALITGASTRLTGTGQFIVGGQAAGSLTIAAGAQVSVALPTGDTQPAAIIGANTGANGSSVTVTGAGSKWAIHGQLVVGDAATATLNIDAHAQVAAASVIIGDQVGATASLLVDSGALSAATLSVGTAGNTHATLALNTGAIAVKGTTSVYGTAAISGGALATHALVDLGQVTLTGGALKCLGAVTGTGTLAIGNHAAVTLGSTEAASLQLDFTAGGGSLTAALARDIASTINNWSAGDVIDLTGTITKSIAYSGHTLDLIRGGTVVGTLTFGGTLAASNFQLTADSHGGTRLTFHS